MGSLLASFLRSSTKFLTRSSIPKVTHTWSEEAGRVSASRVYTSFSRSLSTLSTQARIERNCLNFWHPLQVKVTRPHFSFHFYKVNGRCKHFKDTFLTGISSESSVALVEEALEARTLFSKEWSGTSGRQQIPPKRRTKEGYSS